MTKSSVVIGIGGNMLIQKKYFKKSLKIRLKSFKDWIFTLCGVPENQISLYFGVPDNQISLCFEVSDNQISLHFWVPKNCSLNLSSQLGLGPLEQLFGTP